MREREKKVILEFCRSISALGGIAARVDRWPEDEDGGGCDAIICRGDERLALEHTTISAYPGQPQDTARFRRVVMPLEQSVGRAFPSEWIEISVPAHSIQTGEDWCEVGKALEVGLVKAITALPRRFRSTKLEMQGVPFPVRVIRHEAGNEPGCHVMRHAPENHEEALMGEMGRAITAKSLQLAAYRREGMTTLLLVEWDDIALLREDLVAGAFQSASQESPVDGLDEVYLADSSQPPTRFFPVKLKERIFPEIKEFWEWWRYQRDRVISRHDSSVE